MQTATRSWCWRYDRRSTLRCSVSASRFASATASRASPSNCARETTGYEPWFQQVTSLGYNKLRALVTTGYEPWLHQVTSLASATASRASPPNCGRAISFQVTTASVITDLLPIYYRVTSDLLPSHVRLVTQSRPISTRPYRLRVLPPPPRREPRSRTAVEPFHFVGAISVIWSHSAAEKTCAHIRQ